MALVLALSIPLNVLAATTLGESLSVDDGGTPDVTLDAGDAYIEGTLEVDGAARFDGDFAVYDAAFPAFVATDGDAQTLIIGKSTGVAGSALDNVGVIMFSGENDASEARLYGSLSTTIYDPADGAEQGFFAISTAAGTGSDAVAAAFMADADANLFIFGNPLGGGASADGLITTNNDGNITIEPDGSGEVIIDGVLDVAQETKFNGSIVASDEDAGVTRGVIQTAVIDSDTIKALFDTGTNNLVAFGQNAIIHDVNFTTLNPAGSVATVEVGIDDGFIPGALSNCYIDAADANAFGYQQTTSIAGNQCEHGMLINDVSGGNLTVTSSADLTGSAWEGMIVVKYSYSNGY